MKQKLIVLITLLFLFCLPSLAQEWSKEDSLWLKNVLEGKEQLKINEDTKKAIEEGRLIAPSRIQYDDPDLRKDFNNAGTPDSSRIRGIDPYSMPPGVYALYVLYIEKMDSAYQVKSLIITDDERKNLESLAATGLGIFYPFTEDYYPGFTIGGQDFNHTLSMIFSADYRRKMHNKTKAIANRNYFDDGFGRPVQFTDRERRQLNNTINSFRPSINVNTGQKRGGIDN